MATVSWDSRVNTRVLRSGTSWSDATLFIEDETKSGKTKRRLAHSQSKRSFSVSMRLSPEEYEYFRIWFKETTFGGLYPFTFPRIDSVDPDETAEYRFTSDGAPSYSNPGGRMIDVSMEWEEV